MLFYRQFWVDSLRTVSVAFPCPNLVATVQSDNPDPAIFLAAVFIGRVSDEILVALLFLDFPHRLLQLAGLVEEEGFASRRFRKLFQGLDDSGRGQIFGPLEFFQDLFAQRKFVADRVDRNIDPPGNLEGFIRIELTGVFDSIGNEQEGSFFVLASIGELRGDGDGVVEGRLAVSLDFIQLFEESVPVRGKRGCNFHLSIGENQERNFVQRAENFVDEFSEADFGFIKFVADRHAAADVQEDRQAGRCIEIILEVCDGPFDFILIDCEILGLEIIDVLGSLVLDRDGDGDGADRNIDLESFFLFLLLAEPRRPGRQAGEAQDEEEDEGVDLWIHIISDDYNRFSKTWNRGGFLRRSKHSYPKILKKNIHGTWK